MINVASVLQQVRNSCILAGIPTEYVEEVHAILREEGIHVMKYPIDTIRGYVNIILLRPLDKDLEKLYFNLYSTYKKDKNQFSINTGRILGYIHPGALSPANISSSFKAYIVLIIRQPDNTTTVVHFFPQRVKDDSDTTYAVLERVQYNVYNLQLPAGFSIESANIYLGK